MNALRDILIIGKVWPEPKSSAAGTRMMQLIDFFREKNYQITFASAANETEFQEDLESLGTSTKHIFLNDDSFDDFVLKLNPAIVMFDRFMTEEQFGWRVTENCPRALRILNTEDLHFVRNARRIALTEGTEVDFQSKNAIREIASIYRCDLTLLVSEKEGELLRKEFQVPSELLYFLPLFAMKTESEILPFEKRSDFVFIGNFLHEPNLDAVFYLKEAIWSHIKKNLPEAKMNIYGAYCPQKVFDLHDEEQGFLVHGRVNNVAQMVGAARISLAPLRFGSGIKGKLLESMAIGTPSITTSIGAEDMSDSANWCGRIENDPQNFAYAAVNLYHEESLWNRAVEIGYEILDRRYHSSIHLLKFKIKLGDLSLNIEKHRKRQFTSKMLQHESLASSKYMSKWIAEKNKKVL